MRRATPGFLAEAVALYHVRLLTRQVLWRAQRDARPELSKRARMCWSTLDSGDAHATSEILRGCAAGRSGAALVNDPELWCWMNRPRRSNPVGGAGEGMLLARSGPARRLLSSHMLSEIELICDRVRFW